MVLTKQLFNILSIALIEQCSTRFIVRYVKYLIIFFSLLPLTNHAQVPGKNIIIITIDGIRWQEIFGGADSSILFAGKYLSKDSISITKKYWDSNPLKRRKAIFPFLWTIVAEQGQLYGNRNIGNKVNTKNPYWFSYPGYNEIFTGFPDTLVNSNDYKANPNENVLAFLNKQSAYVNKVVAFANWNAFKRILNEQKSGFMVNDGLESLPLAYIKDPVLKTLDEIQFRLPALWGEDRMDGLTYHIAKQYMISQHPKVVYISFGETDEWAHSGKYDYYLDAAAYTDDMINDCWNYLQSDKFYKGNTILLITTDHGRGIGEQWTSHNNKTPFSNETWFAVLGPGIKSSGEIKEKQQLYQAQLAQTIASLLGFVFTTDHPVEEKVMFTR
ncbi:MAG TPA: sulfatase-like hydrolase/transferase [Ferruginibacter sp.]|nr:sulfatase-like hydrolase/transferase [Ferruginibacter sp.]